MDFEHVLDADDPRQRRARTRLIVPLGPPGASAGPGPAQGQAGPGPGQVGPGPDLGSAVEIPVLILRGCKPGPTLMVAGAVHGDEFDGPEAIRRLWRATREDEMAGTLLALPVLNVPAYLTGGRVNPNDPRDMSGVWPGSEAGSPTERIAWAVSQRVIPGADVVMDLHSGGNIFQIHPLAMYHEPEDAGLREQITWLARCAGIPYLWRFPGPSGLSGYASRVGKPSIGTELGGEARLSEAAVEMNLEAVRNVMRAMGMIEGSPTCPDPDRWRIIEGRPDHSREPGFLVPRVAVGDRVEQGQKIGSIVDPWGDEAEGVYAPHCGIVTTVRTMPILERGGATFQVSRVVGEMTKTPGTPAFLSRPR